MNNRGADNLSPRCALTTGASSTPPALLSTLISLMRASVGGRRAHHIATLAGFVARIRTIPREVCRPGEQVKSSLITLSAIRFSSTCPGNSEQSNAGARHPSVLGTFHSLIVRYLPPKIATTVAVYVSRSQDVANGTTSARL